MTDPSRHCCIGWYSGQLREMEYIKRAIYGPDPKTQKRKCEALIRKNQRELDKQLAGLKASENKSRAMIRQVSRRKDNESARLLAKEIYKAQKHREKLLRTKAQLGSVQLQVGEAFAVQKLQGSMAVSASLMKEVNSLVSMPEIMSTMAQLGNELVKSGIIDSFVQDSLDLLEDEDTLDEEETEAEIAAILKEATETGNSRTQAGESRRKVQPATQNTPLQADKEDDNDMDAMRARLQQLLEVEAD